jgi:hypothetical protein
MTDPFSITAGTVGIAGVALQSTTALIDDIQAIKDTEAIAELKEDLAAIETVLRTLDWELEGLALDVLSPGAKAGLGLATTNCTRACDKFRAKLKKWTKHSADDKMHWWDRVRAGLFAEAEIEVLSEQLRRCKDTVNAAIGTAILYVPVALSCHGSNYFKILLHVLTRFSIDSLPLVHRRSLSKSRTHCRRGRSS